MAVLSDRNQRLVPLIAHDLGATDVQVLNIALDEYAEAHGYGRKGE